jgi:hypothetical protein
MDVIIAQITILEADCHPVIIIGSDFKGVSDGNYSHAIQNHQSF